MTNDDELLKDADIQKIAEKGEKIYERLKIKYEPRENGKFLAIDVDSGNEYLGNTSAEALELARSKHPNKIFYVVKIGFDVVETMAKSYIEKHQIK
ncbi:MAG: hypothetical protein V1843_00735 [bacterium]